MLTQISILIKILRFQILLLNSLSCKQLDIAAERINEGKHSSIEKKDKKILKMQIGQIK